MRQPVGCYRIITVGRQLGVGVAGSHFLEVSAVAKKNTARLPYCVPNELICGEIGRFLRLPVPPCGIVRSDVSRKDVWFASLDFTSAGDTPPPADARQCAKRLPDLVTGILCFDILVANTDRHCGNMAFESRNLRMHIFDHSHALFGCAGSGQGRVSRL